MMDLKSIIVQHCGFFKYTQAALAFGVEGFHDDPKYFFGLVTRSVRFPSVDVLFDSCLSSPHIYRVQIDNWGNEEHYPGKGLSGDKLALVKSVVSSHPSDRKICKFMFKDGSGESGLYLNIGRVDGKYVAYEVWCPDNHRDLILAEGVPFSDKKPLLEAVIAQDARFVEVK